MYQLKRAFKKLLPRGVRQPILNQWHLLEAVTANLVYGFPAKHMQVVMVTGTNGKTTVASLVAQMLESAGHQVGVNTTAFYRYDGKTVPKEGSRTLEDIFVLQRMIAAMRKAGCDFLVLEATSQGLEQNRLWGVPCDVAIMTNLTQDHLDYHGTMERYAAAKGRLFTRKPRIVVLNRDDQWFDYFNKFEAGERKVSYGTTKDAICQIAKVDLHKDGSDIKLVFDGEHAVQLHTKLPGKFNVYNAAAAACAGYYLQLDPDQIAAGIDALATVPGRLERIDEGQPFEVVVDYAHTPDALENVLGTLKSLTKGRLFIVFGATGDRDRTKRPVMGKIAATLADKLFVTDEETYTEDGAAIRAAILKGVAGEKAEYKTTEIADRRAAIVAAITDAKAGDTVVITGMGHETSRNMGGRPEPWSDVKVAREALRSHKS